MCKKEIRKKAISMVLLFVFIISLIQVPVFAKDKTVITDWDFSVFGSNTSEEKNQEPLITEDNKITMVAKGGKIAGGDEGMSFLFKELSDKENFTISVTAKINDFNSDTKISTPNQKSFGIMLRDSIGEHNDSSKLTSKYVGIGVLDTVIKPFYKYYDKETDSLKQVKEDAFKVEDPNIDTIYNLSIKKMGDSYTLKCNNQENTIILEDNFNNNIYAGIYVARDANIEFSNLKLVIDNTEIKSLYIDSSKMKTNYLINERLNTENLVVKAIYMDDSEKEVAKEDYVIGGFDSSKPGKNTVKIYHKNIVQSLDLTISPLTLTGLNIKYLPIKTDYYIGDKFDEEGIEIIAEYNNGYTYRNIDNKDYVFKLNKKEINSDFTFTDPGKKVIDVISRENEQIKAKLNVNVSDAKLEKLHILSDPEKNQYYIGDELDLRGLVIQAIYSNGSKIRLENKDYQVLGFNTEVAGDKEVTIAYKDKKATLKLNVKEREITGLDIIKYPKTTYNIGEELDFSDMVIARVYDNGDKEPIDSSFYTINKDNYNKNKQGKYTVYIISQDERTGNVSLNITVQEMKKPIWKSIVFGQSINKDKNYIEIDNDKVRLVANEGGGKVTGDHDGITFYYTELDAASDNFKLSADIKVNSYAKNPHDGQESFGIMARDSIGTNLDASVFASNIAAIGGYSGGTREENGTQLFVRTGVTSQDGSGSEGIQSKMLLKEKPNKNNTYPENKYRLTLSKTNSGFTGTINNNEEEIIYTPDILKVQDDKMYVGFYVARLADIEISNIDLQVSRSDTDMIKVEAPRVPVEPEINFISPRTTSNTSYNVIANSNVDGQITIKQNDKILVENRYIKAGEKILVPTNLINNDKTTFSLVLYPDDRQLLTSYEKVIYNTTVDMRTFLDNQDIYVSPKGSNKNSGTKSSPLDLDTAIKFVQENQKIIMLEGNYLRNKPLEIEKYNDGGLKGRKYLMADKDAKVVIDFDKKSEGAILSGNYWHIKGIDFINSAGNTKGFTVGGNHNIIELCNFYNNGDTGLQISRTDDSNNIKDWPSYNLILNCTSYNNSDPSQNNADGFGAKLTTGFGNVFDGCIAYNNVDDGWDLYTKAGSGAIGAVVIKNSITYGNGRLLDGKETKGDGNGFKLGGEGIHVPHILENSIAFDNEAAGITSNSNPGLISRNNISFNNAGGNADFRTYTNIKPDFEIDGFISYQSDYTVKDVYPKELSAPNNFMFDGVSSKNSKLESLTDSDFKSLTRDLPFKRDSDGNIIWGDFLQLNK